MLLIVTVLSLGLAAPASAAVPTVSSVSPSSGSLEGGVNVTVKGKDFTGTTGVTVGGTNATSFAIVSDTELIVQVPATSTAGDAAIVATNGTGPNTTGASFKYVAPTVTKIDPAYADADTSKIVTITGTGFTGVTAAEVKFGTNVALAVWVVSDNKLVVKTPINDTDPDPDIVVDNGVTDVTVTSNSVASATGTKSKFLFTPGLPTITQLGSGSQITGTDGAAIGATLSITGTRLWGVSKVKFGSTSVTSGITINSGGTSLDVTVPNRGNGPVEVTVENAAGTSLTNLKTQFSYYSATAPTITSLYPSVFDKAASGGGGTLLVTGRGFTGVGTSDVTVVCSGNITPTSATPVSDTSLILVIPGNSDTAATCDLKVDNPLDGTKTTTKADVIRYV
jgi:hypothetical protein